MPICDASGGADLSVSADTPSLYAAFPMNKVEPNASGAVRFMYSVAQAAPGQCTSRNLFFWLFQQLQLVLFLKFRRKSPPIRLVLIRSMR